MSEAETARRGRPAREALRAESPRISDDRARAEARAAELLDHGVMDQSVGDEFYVPASDIPDGWSYEWKRRSVLGAEDPSYNVAVAQMGWEPVPLSRHPHFMPEGWPGKTIEKKGMILMERPAQITERIKARDHKAALQPVRDMEAKLAGTPQGTFERDADPRTKPKVTRNIEHIPVPD
jgi:hypothetical protein